jgi:hypothetical protein
MNRPAIVLAAIVSFAIGIGILITGQNLILPLAVMKERAGGMPWYITWAMVLITVSCAMVLGGFLVSATRRK